MAAKLVPLNIPGGWVVLRNTFADEDPILQNGWIVNVQSYGEDLLLIQALSPQANDLTIDPQGDQISLGWYPQGDPQGHYRLTLGPADGDIFVRYESQHRESIRKAINLCLSQIQQGNSRETIQQQLEDSTPELEYNPRIFSGTRKSFVHQPIQKKNRLTYSQVSLWFPFYYEVANLMQISQKPNRATYGGFVAENAKC